MTTADNLAAQVRKPSVLRTTVERYVRTRPNTAEARMLWQTVREQVKNPNVTRFDVEVAALDCGLEIDERRARTLERRPQDDE